MIAQAITPRKPPTVGRPNGFALVITLSLMVLLTLLAVGLLTLSAVTLRASSAGQDMAVARANARLALILALGELQTYTGPDKVVTATSEVVSAKPAKPHLTGVWDSWDYNPNTPNLDYTGKKRELFRRWLVSDKDFLAKRDRDYPTTPPQGETIKLVGAASLGSETVDSSEMTFAGKVPVYRNGKSEGAYAWHIADESVKARINSYRDPSQNQAMWQKVALLAGHRADPTVITATDAAPLSFLPTDEDSDKYKKAIEVSGKLVSLNQVDLLTESRKIAKYRNHVTLFSTGLPVNVRAGGLKQDLSSVFGMTGTTLPPVYTNQRLYASTHKITGVSDPYWSTLKGYSDVYRETTLNNTSPLIYQAPQEAVPLLQATTPPKKYYPAPVIERVELLFSVIVRESHGPWSAASTGLTQSTRMVHLLYAPIITLHNPYNVGLKFDQLDLDIKGIPMAFNFTVNDQPQNSEPVSFNELFVNGPDRLEKSFILSISNWSSFDATAPSSITMKPGQTLVCGPYLNGDAIFGGSGGEGSSVFFDYDNNLTGTTARRAKCKPGFLGRQVSYDVDWLTLGEHASGYSTDGNRGVLIVKPEDRFFVEWKVKANTGILKDKMTVNATLTSKGTAKEIGGLEFDFDDSALGKGYPTIYRFPDAKSLPNSLLVEDLYHGNLTAIKTHTKVKSFALLSAYARTANGGVYDNGTRDKLANGQNLQLDGRLAGLPFLHHNPALTPTVVDLKTDLPGRYPQELNVQPLTGTVDDIFQIDATNRGYGLTSNKVTRGIKSGSYLELPLSPMQTIADFRRSNALTSAMLPHFVQPVSNSYSSPLMATSGVIQTGVARYALLDHSVLANHALYDKFYFSTFTTYGTKAVEDVFTDFMSHTKPLVAQSFEPYLPQGKTVDQAKAELFSGGRAKATAYETAAEYQLIRGAFNVNSADVQAWKAVLSSMSNTMVQSLWATTATITEKLSQNSPILPMTLVNGGAVGSFNPANDATKIDTARTNDWNGYRQISPSQLTTLAEKIVDEVRKRGPFLSLSEFVNRRIGTESDLTRLGALQAAIDESKINANFLVGSVTDVRAADVSDQRIYKYSNPAASLGNPAAGAPGWVSQGDLMRILEPGATVRADTFVIRVSGEAHDAKGRVTARAYAEALVQRMPEYVNPIDRPSTNVWNPDLKVGEADNKKFGRRLNVVAFRWLAESEI